MSQNKAYIALGTNIGNWKNNFNQTFFLLNKIGIISNFSSVYLSKPQGYLNQELFYNTLIELKTILSPFKLMEEIKIIEKIIKKHKVIINGPRRIDLDIIFYNKLILKNKLLEIPHPRAHLRDFVLKPMDEIKPYFIHPIEKKTIRNLLNSIKKNYILKKIIRQKESLIIF